MKRKKLVIGLIGGSTIASFFLGFVCHKSVGWAGSLPCNTSDPNVKKVDCDNLPSKQCSEYEESCRCGGTSKHNVHVNETGGPCGGQDRIEHTPETHTNYTCEGCDHDFLTVPNVSDSEECRPVIHLSNPEEHLTTHIEHISEGGHIAYVESVGEEVSGEEDAGYSARGEAIEDIDIGPGEDSWCLHKNECNFHNSCGHCSYPHTNHCVHNDICVPENDPYCQHTDDTPCVDHPHVSYNG